MRTVFALSVPTSKHYCPDSRYQQQRKSFRILADTSRLPPECGRHWAFNGARECKKRKSCVDQSGSTLIITCHRSKVIDAPTSRLLDGSARSEERRVGKEG